MYYVVLEKAGSSEGVRRSWETRKKKRHYEKTSRDVREVSNASLTWGQDVWDYYNGLRKQGKSHEAALKQVNQAGEYRARTRIGKEPLRPLQEFEGKVWKWEKSFDSTKWNKRWPSDPKIQNREGSKPIDKLVEQTIQAGDKNEEAKRKSLRFTDKKKVKIKGPDEGGPDEGEEGGSVGAGDSGGDGGE